MINIKINLLIFTSLILQKDIQNRYVRLLSSKGNFKLFFIFYFLFSFFYFHLVKSETNNLINFKNNKIENEYLESRNELEDYILDTGDIIALDFFPAIEFNGFFPVNQEGEILLPEIDETFVRGLTTSELRSLLEKRYAEFLIDPEIKVRIVKFKSIRILARGEIRNPGYHSFPAYASRSFISLDQSDNSEFDLLTLNNQSSDNIDDEKSIKDNIDVERSIEDITTLSDVIRKAGGITSKTDLSRIEIIRNIPLGKGGGKKRAIIDFNNYIKQSETNNDIRIFDGDSLFFPKLSNADPNQIPKSVLSGISPKFISVNVFGRVETPGIIRVPLEATLSDAIDLTGPIKPLSGKIVLIRYQNDGTLIKKNISYSARAVKGSKRNPYLKEDDLITVQNSIFGKTTGVLNEFTAPFVGIYSTKELIEGFTD
ncbi:Periplasmic protein involved in polysaccharide export [Prochlorococcus marinus str. MIT 9215]|uniref:Periplasmic protein involved in polysaccharide export n=1 Tax=Prochlorococcus marinus (strain MIT 9215) TaxID=93060 RepID=A8G689_PROM2|nr:Periplasmic protein involved in polysaccharide export [Prochlorococcus marinus str. MIT 9215]